MCKHLNLNSNKGERCVCVSVSVSVCRICLSEFVMCSLFE